MNNKRIYIIFATVLAVFLCTADAVFAKPVIDAATKSEIIKIAIAMLGIAGSTILITVGLSIYNRFFVPEEIKNYKFGKNSLKSPSDKNEAIMMYLSKNKLK